MAKDRVELHKRYYTIQTLVSRELDIPEANVKYEELEDCMLLGMIKRLQLGIWGETLDVEEYPTGLWDAIKLKLFPKWLLNKFPASMTKLEAIALYPRISFPEQHSKIVIIKTD